MKSITAKTFPAIGGVKGMSTRALDQHYRLYTGYVEKFNALAEKLAQAQQNGGSDITLDTQSMKVDVTYALAAVKNHELYFDLLTGAGEPASGPLADAIKANFGGMERFLVDLRQTAMASRGWCWTAFDLDLGHLFNYAGSTQSAIPVWNAIPILGIDMYAHAYLYDFDNNRRGYVDAVVAVMDWEKVAAVERRRGADGPRVIDLMPARKDTFMSTKQLVQQVIDQMPDDASIEDVMRALALVADIQKAEYEADQVEGIPHEVMKERVKDLAGEFTRRPRKINRPIA